MVLLSGVPLASLPAEMQARVRAQMGAPAQKKRTTKKEVGGKVSVWCHTCGEHFTSTEGKNGYEEHSDETGHRRFDCLEPLTH